MDLALFLTLPLIGGFAFVTRFSLLRYRTGREEAQRLYYRAALSGVILTGVAALIHVLLYANSAAYLRFTDRLASVVITPLLEKERSTITLPLSSSAMTLRVDTALVCAYAFLLGALTPLWNGIIQLFDWAWMGLSPSHTRRSLLGMLNLRSITDQLERLIAESLSNASLVQVTLNNSKVYVGSVLESLNPSSPAKYFKLQPWMSGFRSPVDGRVTFNTYYDDVLAELEKGRAEQRAVATFQLIIPIDKVVSASGFDLGAYEQFILSRENLDTSSPEHAPKVDDLEEVGKVREPAEEGDSSLSDGN